MLVTTHGSVFVTVRGSMTTISSGWSFYDR